VEHAAADVVWIKPAVQDDAHALRARLIVAACALIQTTMTPIAGLVVPSAREACVVLPVDARAQWAPQRAQVRVSICEQTDSTAACAVVFAQEQHRPVTA
jgi:hypothetical protein